MYNPYDLHSWSKLCREDALREARTRQLSDCARPNRTSGGRGLFGLVSKGALVQLLLRVVPAEGRPP